MMQGPEETVDGGMIMIGPVGNPCGNSWDEKGRSEIVQIFVSHDDKICSLQFQYFEDGKLVLSARQGSNAGFKFDTVKLNYPSEYLTCVSGFKTAAHVSSITFITNLETYGPFGEPLNGDREFRFQLGKDKQFGGFWGSANKCLRSIGVYIQPIKTLKEGDCTQIHQLLLSPSPLSKIAFLATLCFCLIYHYYYQYSRKKCCS